MNVGFVFGFIIGFLGYIQIGIIVGVLIYKRFEKYDPDADVAAGFGGVFWPIGILILLGSIVIRWEFRLMTEGRRKKKEKPKRSKRHPLRFKHKVSDPELIAQMERELQIAQPEPEPEPEDPVIPSPVRKYLNDFHLYKWDR